MKKLPAFLLIAACASCGGVGAVGDPWAGGATQLAGIVGFDSGLEMAGVTLSAAYAGPTSTVGSSGNASGKLGAVALTGSFDPSSRQLTLSDGGQNSVTASADSSGMVGVGESATGPGAFAVEPQAPTRLCGSFSGSLAGALGLVYGSTGRAIAVYVISGAQSRGTLEGTISGGALSFESAISFNGHDLTIEGSAGGASAHGTWRDTDTTSGTWSATACP
jgi:hypothetical protein